ncbi:hypothetical protein D3C76_735230 [compost metagenome]
MLYGTDLDASRRTAASVLDGIGYQVVQGHVDECRVADHLGQRGDVPNDCAAFVIGGQLAANGLDQGVEVDVGQAQGRAAHLREVEQVVDQAAGKVRRFTDMLEEALAAFAQALAFDFAKQFGIAGDVPQRGAQVVGNTVGKRFELLVGTAQFASQLCQLFSLAQDNAQHSAAQLHHALDHQWVPRLTIAAQFFLPTFKTVPWVEVALWPDLLGRLPGPVDRAYLLGAEPQQVVRVDLRDGHRQHPASMVCQLG